MPKRQLKSLLATIGQGQCAKLIDEYASIVGKRLVEMRREHQSVKGENRIQLRVGEASLPSLIRSITRSP